MMVLLNFIYMKGTYVLKTNLWDSDKLQHVECFFNSGKLKSINCSDVDSVQWKPFL